ncbi:DUF5686 family protein [Luteibaculum oceani]|uniref:Carboxypeptidase-like regulatory domain-containing protein n=1 Tax=Luteibaculum oceani TaxID=1294296 RepID=A0A5C6UYF8_9FLAO|nr:DUF5686 family protein [Luteibaculum oceani]TXC78452.1 carboxypeptidase-like regulatory domain-containing protein [Luteibaculum oceani]
MKNLLAFVSCFILFGISGISQNVKLAGSVIDEHNNPMPYVNIYLLNKTYGTSTNFEGKFEFVIPQSSFGENMGLKFVGYQEKKISTSNFKPNNSGTYTLSSPIQLKPQEVNLNEVVISAKGKDPAYYIIRQAIKSKAKYQNPNYAYEAKLYMKGRAFFSEAPDSSKFMINIMMDDNELAELKEQEKSVVFLSESVSKVWYTKKDGVKEELLADKQSGTFTGFTPNRSVYLNNNFYENRMGGINQRGIISPLNNNSFFYYDFKLLGKFKENGLTVNRIQVIPKRKSDPVFYGEIFIVQDLWNIHSLDLTAGKSSMDNLVLDSVSFKQSYQMIDSIWVPLSLQSNYHIKMFGFGLSYQILGRYLEYKISNPNEERAISEMVSSKFDKNEVYQVSETRKTNDSILMQSLRPIALDSSEIIHYRKEDSVVQRINSPAYKDSVLKARNKFRPNQVISGYRYTYKSGSSIDIEGVRESIFFTAVDGWVLAPQVKIRLEDSSTVFADQLVVQPRYAFGRKAFNLDAAYVRNINPINLTQLYLSAGSTTRQINGDQPISRFLNTYYSFFRERNYAQFVEEYFAEAKYRTELFNGLLSSFGVKAATRSQLSNLNPIGVFKNFEDRTFSPNIQSNHNGDLFQLSVDLRYQFNQKYSTYPDYKLRYSSSRYPTLYFHGAWAPKQLSASQFTHLEAGLKQTLNLGIFGRFEYSGYAGTFLNKANQSFYDFKHFMGNQIPFINGRSRAFQTAPYYNLSTNSSYLELHAEQRFNGFLMNKIPLIKKLKVQSYVGVNSLAVENQKLYNELYFGIENIFSVLSVQVAGSMDGGKIQSPVFMVGLKTVIN